MYIFISYSSKNTDEATKICEKLENSGHKCFLAYRDITGGAIYAEELIKALDKSDAVLLLLSEGANNSPHVLREMERACSKNIPIIVYKLEEVVLSKGMEYFLMTHQWVTRDDNDEKLISVFKKIEERKHESEGTVNTSDAKNEEAVKRVEQKNEQGKSGKSVIMLAIIAVLLVTIIVLLAIKILKDDNDNANQQEIEKFAQGGEISSNEQINEKTDGNSAELINANAADNGKTDDGAAGKDVTNAGKNDNGSPGNDVTDAGKNDDGTASNGVTDTGKKDTGKTDDGTTGNDVIDAGKTDDGAAGNGATDTDKNDNGTAGNDVTDTGKTDDGTADNGETENGNIGNSTGSLDNKDSDDNSDGEISGDNVSNISRAVADMNIGDCITIGSYREEPIEWIALHKNGDGSTILISKKILCLKMFDAPESGSFGTCTDESLLNGEEPLDCNYWTNSKPTTYGPEALIQAYGNNDWSVSNIRNWLNSDKNLVKYEDAAPGKISMYDKWPSYSGEMGFLKNFTEEELNALSEYSYEYVNSITGEKKTLKDKVFMLSEDELDWFFAGDISPLAQIMNSALAEDYENMYEMYNEDGYYFWWLRDGSENAACKNKYVTTYLEELVFEYISCYYGYGGIRPCICIK